jgi:translation initiation factor 1 (eIF-1/SUI1)
LKKASKKFSGKFAASASVDNAADEISVTGDHLDEIVSVITSNFPDVPEGDITFKTK